MCTKYCIVVIYIGLILVSISSCDDLLDQKLLIYENKFEENESLDQITGAIIHTFNNSLMLGNYNNDGFLLFLSNIPEHQRIQISFDLYIHDSWDGNQEGISGPDFWFLRLDNIDSDNESSSRVFRTTFSNTVCDYQVCYYQSYPFEYPFSNEPRTGAIGKASGVCNSTAIADGSTLYKFEKIFEHRQDNLVLRFHDEAVQLNARNGACDESWSLDNLKVWIL